ncbi:MAG TPA: MlaD family protein [Solirubrobacteraceae bacterium]|nr:MlaD family protein [Solirubrobacteraceae bacterium]
MSRGGRIAALVALLGALVLLALILLGGGDGYTVTARFQAAGQLVRGNLVQYAGREVGKTGDIELGPDGTAEVELKISDPDFRPLRVGTTATIRQASLSGVANRYVDLTMPRGEVDETIPDNGVIPLEHTVTSVDLDHLFNLFDKRTRKGLRNVIRGFGASYEDKSQLASEGWRYLNPSLVAARRLFEELSRDKQALESFVVDNARLVNDLSARRDDVVKLVDRLSTTFDAIAVEKGSLQSAVAQLPPFMRRANTTFVNLRATLDDLDPLIEASAPVTPKLRRVLAELRPFARDAKPTVRDLAALVRSPGKANDLIDLGKSIFPFRDVTMRENEYNGQRRPGSFATSTRSLREQTPQWAFQRAYAPDLTGWFDDFSHSGIFDANGSASRVSTNVSALAFLDGLLRPVPEDMRAQVIDRVAALHQRNRCPGATERPAEDKSNPFKPTEDFNCDPEQLPPGP